MSSVENPYQAPQGVAPSDQPGFHEHGGLWRKGSLLVMHKGGALPPRCVKSNTPTKRSLKRKLTWHHPAVFIALLFNLLIYVILAIVLSKRATIHIGLSDAWFAKRRRAMLIAWTIVLTSIGMFAAAIAASDRYETAAPLVAIASPLVFIAGAIYGLLAARMVAPTRITDDYVWLKGVCPQFLEPLPEWPYAP